MIHEHEQNMIFYDEDDEKNRPLYAELYKSFMHSQIEPIGDREITTIEADSVMDAVRVLSIRSVATEYVINAFEQYYRYGVIALKDRTMIITMGTAFMHFVTMRIEPLLPASVLFEVDMDEAPLQVLKDEEKEVVKIKTEIKNVVTEEQAISYACINRDDSVKSMVVSSCYYSKKSAFAFDSEIVIYKGRLITLCSLAMHRDTGSFEMWIEILYPYLNPKQKLDFRLLCHYGALQYNCFLKKKDSQLVYKIFQLNMRLNMEIRHKLMIDRHSQDIMMRSPINLMGNLLLRGEVLSHEVFMMDEIDPNEYAQRMYNPLVNIMREIAPYIPGPIYALTYEQNSTGRIGLLLTAMVLIGWMRRELVSSSEDLDTSGVGSMYRRAIRIMSEYKYLGTIQQQMRGCMIRVRQIIGAMIFFPKSYNLSLQCYDPYKNPDQMMIRNCFKLREEAESYCTNNENCLALASRNHHTPFFEVNHLVNLADRDKFKFW